MGSPIHAQHDTIQTMHVYWPPLLGPTKFLSVDGMAAKCARDTHDRRINKLLDEDSGLLAWRGSDKKNFSFFGFEHRSWGERESPKTDRISKGSEKNRDVRVSGIRIRTRKNAQIRSGIRDPIKFGRISDPGKFHFLLNKAANFNI